MLLSSVSVHNRWSLDKPITNEAVWKQDPKINTHIRGTETSETGNR